MNKKGFAPLLLLAIAGVVVAMILLIGSFFSSELKYTLIGIAVLGAFVWLVGKGITSDRGFDRQTIIVLFIFLGVGLFFIFGNGVFQSVLSQSSIYTEGGKTFWVFTASVNNLNEKVTFTKTPSSYTQPDGTKVTPQTGLSISMSKIENSCEYRVTKRTKSYYFGLVKYEYYILNNPERIALIKLEDNNGNVKTMDATLVDSVVFNDNDGKGSATVQTQGILGGKVNCPSYENVAIYYENNQLRIVEKASLEAKINSVPSLLSGLSQIYDYFRANVQTNTAFPSSFTNFGFDGNSVLGTLNFGNGLITITADQDYFDSVVYSPPKEVDPRINNINIPQEIKADATESVRVDISNALSGSEGTIIVKATASGLTINPSSSNVLLRNSATVYFNVKASSNERTSEFRVEACSTSQFGSPKCDVETKSFTIIKETETPSGPSCGDGICQSNENSLTCISDCPIIVNNNDSSDSQTACAEKASSQPFLGWTWVESTDSSCGLNPLCLLGITDPKITTTGQCKASFLVYYIIGGVILVLGVATIFLIKSTPKRKKRR